MTPHERLVLQEALQAEAESRREAMRKQEQAFGAVVCVVCIIIISCVAVGAGFRSVRNMVEARQAQQEVRK
jgi:uncharacterized membrane protein YvbJ